MCEQTASLETVALGASSVRRGELEESQYREDSASRSILCVRDSRNVVGMPAYWGAASRVKM